ncbi:hypothetical protein [Nonomuraea sp. NPDC050786]|uniref:hypothetical protein n=1 Tax=Nonomuraea sp. NPDC050786 TaxID=3154840 RepID=UPI0033DF9893
MEKKLPGVAQKLVDLAQAQGWLTAVNWNEDTDGNPFVSVELGRKDPEYHVQLSWHSRQTQGRSLRLFTSLWRCVPASHLDVDRPRHSWRDLSSLKMLRETIESTPVQEVEKYESVPADQIPAKALIWDHRGRHQEFLEIEESGIGGLWYARYRCPDTGREGRFAIYSRTELVKLVAS